MTMVLPSCVTKLIKAEITVALSSGVSTTGGAEGTMPQNLAGYIGFWSHFSYAKIQGAART